MRVDRRTYFQRQADARQELSRIIARMQERIDIEPENLAQAIARMAEVEALTRQARLVLQNMGGE